MQESSTNIAVRGQLVCANEQEAAAVLFNLPEHTRLTRAEPGCLKFAVTQSADPLVFEVEERFLNQEAFDAHQARLRGTTWWEATQKIHRSYEVTEV